jgi:hypothetical protein
VPVHRAEVYEEIQRANRAAVPGTIPQPASTPVTPANLKFRPQKPKT